MDMLLWWWKETQNSFLSLNFAWKSSPESKCLQKVLEQAASFVHFYLPFLHDHICICCTAYAFRTNNVITVLLQLRKSVNDLFSETFSQSSSSVCSSFSLIRTGNTKLNLTLLLCIEHLASVLLHQCFSALGLHTANDAQI